MDDGVPGVNVLTVNAGSSSLKLSVVDADDPGGSGTTTDLPGQTPASMVEALVRFLGDASPFEAVGHRIVHGGPVFAASVLVDAGVEEALAGLSDLAPLHNPPALEAVAALRRLRPGVPQVACFDTAFHATLPPGAATYALPREWNTRWGLRRYGFHGLSHAYAGRRAAELIGVPAGRLRLVTAHLGAGASLTAVAGGRSVDTTMGFTPLAGLVMATRSGDVDPGLLLWLVRNSGLSAQEIERALEHDSGLLGLSGVSADLRAVLAAVDAGDVRARLAYSVYLHRLRAGIAAMAAAMGGLDGLVFTAGAGERSGRLRADAGRGLEFLGISVDVTANERGNGDRLLSPPSPVAVVVVDAREDLEIAREVREVLGSRPRVDGGRGAPAR